MSLLRHSLCFFAMLGADASSKDALLRSGLKMFLAPSGTEAVMLDAARTSQVPQEMDGESCFVWWLCISAIPICCCAIGCPVAGPFALCNPCVSVPLFLFSTAALIDLMMSGHLQRFLNDEIKDPTCQVVIIMICFQAFLGFVVNACLCCVCVGVSQAQRQQDAQQEAMNKAMEAQMKRYAESMAKQKAQQEAQREAVKAQEQKKEDVVAEIKKELAEIEDVLDEEHKVYYASDEFKAKCDLIFDNADTNKNGVIDPDEFQAALAAALDDNMVPTYQKEFFKAFDIDNDHKIEREEFHILMKYIDSHGPATLKETSLYQQVYGQPQPKVVSKVTSWPPPKRD